MKQTITLRRKTSNNKTYYVDITLQFNDSNDFYKLTFGLSDFCMEDDTILKQYFNILPTQRLLWLPKEEYINHITFYSYDDDTSFSPCDYEDIKKYFIEFYNKTSI